MLLIPTRRTAEDDDVSADQPDVANSRYTRATQTEPGRDSSSQTDELRQFCRLRLYQVVTDWLGNNTCVGLYSFRGVDEALVPEEWQPLDQPEGTLLSPSPSLVRAGTTRLYERCSEATGHATSSSSSRRSRAATRSILSDGTASPDGYADATPTRDLAATSINDDVFVVLHKHIGSILIHRQYIVV